MNWMPRYGWNRLLTVVLACLICLVAPLAQFSFRRFDDNPFTGWHLIFLTTPHRNLLFVLICGMLLAWAAFRISLPVPRALGLFLACFFAAALFWSVPEINTVAARIFTQAKHLELYGISSFLKEWGHGIQAWMDLPAAPFFDGLVFKVFGESRVSIQLFTAFLFGMTAVLAYLIGKTLWDKESGFYGGLLLLGIPYLVIQMPLMLLDVPTMFFLTLSIYLFIRAIDAGGIGREIAAACAIFIAFFCKYSVWPMLSVLPVISTVYYFRKQGTLPSDAALFREGSEEKIGNAVSRRVLQRTLRVFLLSLLLVGVPLLLKFDVLIDQVKLMEEFLRPSLGRWTETRASIFLFQVNPAITLAAVASLFLAARDRDLKYLIVAWLPFLAVFFEITRVRFWIPVFPMLTLMAARGLLGLQNRDLRRVIVASIVATSLATCFFIYRPFLNQWSAVNLEEAGRFLDTLAVEAVEVIAVPQRKYPVNPAVAVPLLDLATHKNIMYHYVPGASTPDEDYHTSRFRDSWEYRNPPYYESGPGPAAGKKAVAVILADINQSIPFELTNTIGKLHHAKSFSTYSPFLANHTIVRIYW